MASYKLELNNSLSYIRVEAFGDIEQEMGEKIITEARTLASENNYDILYDMRAASSKVQLSDWFHLPRTLDVYRHKKARFISAAVLLAPDEKMPDQYKFFETVVGNLGFRLKIFFEENEALEWLAKKNLKNPEK